MEPEGAEHAPPGSVSAVLRGAPTDELISLGQAWGRTCIGPLEEPAREGLALILAVAGLPASRLPNIDTASPALATTALGEWAGKSVPPDGSLATLSASAAWLAVQRLEYFFGAAISVQSGNAATEDLSAALHALLRWLPSLANSMVRELRHAATAAALGALEALTSAAELAHRGESVMATSHVKVEVRERGAEELSPNLDERQVQAQMAQKAEASRLLAKALRQSAKLLEEQVLQPRLLDASATIRKQAISGVAALVAGHPGTYGQGPPWPGRVLRAVCDPSALVRRKAVEATSEWYMSPRPAPLQAGGGDGAAAAQQVKNDEPLVASSQHLSELTPRLAALLAERSLDTHPQVALAALRAVAIPKLAGELREVDRAMIAEVCLNGASKELRGEATRFAEEHIIAEEGSDGAALNSQASLDSLRQSAFVQKLGRELALGMQARAASAAPGASPPRESLIPSASRKRGPATTVAEGARKMLKQQPPAGAVEASASTAWLPRISEQSPLRPRPLPALPSGKRTAAAAEELVKAEGGSGGGGVKAEAERKSPPPAVRSGHHKPPPKRRMTFSGGGGGSMAPPPLPAEKAPPKVMPEPEPVSVVTVRQWRLKSAASSQ
mmetsp:Transcript_20189/g.47069  ORF Transcript_20189/g.47069 Transcript_20189/m.47069 type:complete len:615 (-) Transcript_20189:34-1878(-)